MSMMIGIDPHKATHTAVAIDSDEQPVARLTIAADRCQTQRLLAWAEPLGVERTWAIESATGLGRLLAQQLVAAGENVIDVPPTLAAMVRLLGSTKASKNDPNDALATAVAGLRHCGLRLVVSDGHTMVLRMLVDRHQALTSSRTQTASRLHVLLRELIAGGAPVRLSAERAGTILRGVHTHNVVDAERKRMVREHLRDLRRLDHDIAEAKHRITDAVTTSGTKLTELHGVEPITAALILGHVGDPATMGANLGESFAVGSSYPGRRSSWGAPWTWRSGLHGLACLGGAFWHTIRGSRAPSKSIRFRTRGRRGFAPRRQSRCRGSRVRVIPRGVERRSATPRQGAVVRTRGGRSPRSTQQRGAPTLPV